MLRIVDILKKLPKSMLQAVDLLPQQETSVILFTRHSIREVVGGQGLAGYDLQLTSEGKDLAYHWGEYLSEHTDRKITNCMSSPIQRCVETAELMIAGSSQDRLEITQHIDILQEPLLVEPGGYVVDIGVAAPYFRQQGAVSFINSFVQNTLPGMKHPIKGVLDVLQLLYQSRLVCEPPLGSGCQLNLAVSHDTILAAFIAVISGHFQVEKKDWPEMMEGLFMWFDNAENFYATTAHWVWRGQHHQLSIAKLMNAKR